MESKEQLHHQTEGWWKNKTIQNSWMKTKDHKVKFQVGGTSTILTDATTSALDSRGQDASGMGRWSWTTIRAADHTKHTTIITAYVPCHSKGETTAYTQQHEHIRNHEPKTNKGVYEIYIRDLGKFIQSQKDKGNRIILMGDFNEDSRDRGRIKSLAKKFNMYNPIQERHGEPTTTYAFGSRPVDAIYISRELYIDKGGHSCGDITLSDHKIIWIDIPRNVILGTSKPTPRPPQRILHTSNPRVKRKYNEELEAELKRQNVPKLVKDLNEAARRKDEKVYIPTYEKLAKIRKNAIKYAEKRCQKRRNGNIPYSPTLKNAMGEITMWKLIYRRAIAKGKYRPSPRMLQRKAKKWNFEKRNLNCKDIDEIKDKLRQAVKQYKMLRKSGGIRRKRFLEDKAEIIADQKGLNAARYLKQLIRIEEQRTTHKHIRYSQKGDQNQGITYLEEETEDGVRTKITQKDTMEDALIEANQSKLQQANNTPLREEPLRSLFNEDRLDYDRWEKVMDKNTPLPEGMERGTRLWFQQMRKPLEVPKSDLQITEEEYIQSWKVRKENTSAHPGLHFGHYKALEGKDRTPIALQLFTSLANVPIMTGYAPKDWRLCTDAMLPKKADDFRPHKLRLITLKNTCSNHHNKILGREMMRNGEKYDQMAPEQYGSRKNKSAIEHALNKVLTLNIAKQKSEDMIFIANDAKSCYDRIILMAAYLAMLRFGITKEAAQAALTSLGTLTHHIRTAKGESIKTYGGNKWVRLPHGIGQGNGAGPAIWVCVSTPLFNALREDGYGTTFQSPITLALLTITGFAFVDDTDLIQVKGNLKTDKDLFIKAQAQLIVWEQLLRTTGGAIEPTKSDWVFIRHKWSKARSTYNYSKYPHEMYVRNSDKEELPMRQLAIREARQTLGVWIAADCNWKEQAKDLQAKATKWASRLQDGTLSPAHVDIAVRTTVMKTLEYGLPATYMNTRMCKQAMSKLLGIVLPRMKINRNINREAVHLPIAYKGLGIYDLETSQGIAHIKMLLLHGGSSSTTGRLLQISLEQSTLEAGTTKSLFKIESNMLKVLKPTWLTNTISFMQKYRIQIDNNDGNIDKWSADDKGIMDIIGNTQRYTTEELQAINACRVFLQVNTITDITTAPTQIIPQAYNLEKYESLSALAYQWPPQPAPTEEDREKWQHAMQHVLRLSPKEEKIEYSHKVTEKAALIATWYHQVREDVLWEKERNCWRKWTRTRTTRTTSYFKTPIIQAYSLREWYPAVICITNRKASIVNRYERSGQQQIHLHEAWIPTGVNGTKESMSNFVDQIQLGTAICVSDGSAKDGRTTAAFKSVQPQDDEPIIQGQFSIPGCPKEQTSYRGELAGILAIITSVNFLCYMHNIKKGKVTIGCDNQAALRTTFGQHKTRPSRSCNDIEQAIRFQQRLTPIKWIPKHVKGHQDRHADYESLDTVAKANVDCDQAARNQMENHNINITHAPLPGERWRLRLHAHVITGHFETELRNHIHHDQAIRYWSGRGQLNAAYASHIDWEAHRKGFKSLPRSTRIHLTKLYAGVQATGKVLHRRGEWATPTCPFCNAIEDHQHIIQCQSAQTNEAYTIAYTSIDDWLEQTTSSEIGQAIWSFLDAYRNQEEITIWATWPDNIKETAKDQWQIGPRSFLEGYLSLKWAEAQQSYLNSLSEKERRNKDGTSWATRLANKLWTLQHKMWKSRCHNLHKEQQDRTESALALNTALARILRHPPPLSMPAEDRKHWIPLHRALQMHPRKKQRLIRRLTTFINAHITRTNSPSAQIMRQWLAQLHPD